MESKAPLIDLDTKLSLLDQWRMSLRSTATFRDSLNRSELILTGALHHFPLEQVLKVSERGSALDFRLSGSGWRLDLRAASGALTIENHWGGWSHALAQNVDEAVLAAEEGRAEDLFVLCGTLECTVTITLHNDPDVSKFHWIRTAEGFLENEKARGWVGFSEALERHEAVRRLIINDAGNERFSTAVMVCHGPEIWPQVPTFAEKERYRAYREMFLQDSRAGLCNPERLAPTKVSGEGRLSALTQWMEATAHALVWVWLADEADLAAPGSPRIIFKGYRDIDIGLTELPPSGIQTEWIELWRWAADTTDSLRREAIQRAISLAVQEPRDLSGASAPVLRTARSLESLAKQGPIAEALATRRAAREAVMGLARASGDQVQAAARSLVDRVLALLAGAVAVVLAYQEDLVRREVSLLLLIGICVLGLVVAVITIFFEYPALRRSLAAVRSDLKTYRDTLVQEEIDALSNLAAVTSAQTTLNRAVLFLIILLLLMAFSLGGATWFVVRTESGDVESTTTGQETSSRATTPKSKVSD